MEFFFVRKCYLVFLFTLKEKVAGTSLQIHEMIVTERIIDFLRLFYFQCYYLLLVILFSSQYILAQFVGNFDIR